MATQNVWKAQIQHVVVLMMENRSFDHLLGGFRRINPACEGIDENHPASNVVKALPGRVFKQEKETAEYFGLPLKPAPFDPKHEFANVLRQLGGSLNAPAMTGFAEDTYASFANQDGFKKNIGDLAQRVMNYIPFGDSPASDPLPGIQGLARAFTVCDHWFSSLPGPTWPNRFFAMMGSAHGRVLMPSDWHDATQGIANFCDQVCKDSIFSLLAENNVSARVYSDGAIPLAAMVKASGTRFDIDQFERDVKANALPDFAWIEPDYSYEGSDGNSQHPPEDLRYGDGFMARIYNLLRANETAWNQTLFVVLYDEHGGFYDHVIPPATIAPDKTPADVDFDFTRLGVRVPAIVASPWIAAGVDKTVYDHTSLLAFVCDRFGLARARLGARVQSAAHFGDAPIWLNQPRTDTPASLRIAKAPPRTRALVEHETGLAAENRRLVLGLHAYLNGQDVEAAWAAATPVTRGMRALQPPQRLENMVAEITQALSRGDMPRPGTRSPVLKETFKAGAALRLLCLHGVGHGDSDSGWQADPGWQDKWRQVIGKNLQAHGVDPQAIEIRWLRYDDLFGDGPSRLQLLRAVPLLLQAMAAEVAGQRAFGLSLPEMLQWTAGMAVQWIEDADLRTRLCERLMDEIKHFEPHAVLAHSLGSLISYDAMRRAVTAGGDAAALIDGRLFASFGSQIAHPVVMREVWGGKVAPLNANNQGIAAWFHLYNPNDRVLTRPINTPDPRRIDITTPFDVPFPQEWIDLNHSAEVYLDHPASQTQLWPVIARGVRTRALSMPAIITRVPPKQRRALLVGINQYPDPAMRLGGCVNDVFLISQTLQQSGYDPAEIRLLIDERATRAEIASRLEWLMDGARPGDERMFFYSGHGAQIPQYGSSTEPDRMDETLVPVDFDWNNDATHFTDKQFREFYSDLPFGSEGQDGVTLSVVFDCCHAGGMTRGGARVRGINPPNDIRHRMLRWDEATHDWAGRDWRESARGPRSYTDEARRGATGARSSQGAASELRLDNKDRFQAQCRLYGHLGPYMPVLMYAAKEDELASEYDHGAQTYGAFTYALVEQLRKKRPQPPRYSELIQTVGAALKRRHFTQNPELVGPRDVRARPIPWSLK